MTPYEVNHNELSLVLLEPFVHGFLLLLKWILEIPESYPNDPHFPTCYHNPH